jgi:DNA-directed RNA polymerase subunit K/omega
MGAPILIDPGKMTDPVEIAMAEFDRGLIPMTVKMKGKRIKGPVV